MQRAAATAFLIVAPLAVAGGAQGPSPTVYAFDSTGGRLVTIDTATGSVEVKGPIAVGTGAVTDLASADGRLYALVSEYPVQSRLLELDPTNGGILSDAVITVGGVAAPNAVESITGLADGTVLIGLWRPGSPSIATSNWIGRVGGDGVVTDLVDFGVDADFDGLATGSDGTIVSLNREPGAGFDFIRLENVFHPAGGLSLIVQTPFSTEINFVDDPVLLGDEILTFDCGTKRINHHDRDTGAILDWVHYPAEFGICAGAAVVWPFPFDLNGDGIVDGDDLGTLLGQWGPCPGCSADFNGDGIVDGDDLGSMLGAWGPVR